MTPDKVVLVVQPHDGTFEGDSDFWAGTDCVPFREGMTLGDLQQAAVAVFREDRDEDEAAEQAVSIIGGWVITEQLAQAARVAIEAVLCGDSAEYAANETAKRMLHQLCQGHVGQAPGSEGSEEP